MLAKDRFVNYITHEKRYSAHTTRAYERDLDQFISFLKVQYEAEDPAQVTQAMIRSWLVALMQDGISSRSVTRKLSTLKSFYRFLLREGIITSNPASRVAAPKMKGRLPEFLDADQMLSLLSNVDFGEGFQAIRDRIVIGLLYGTGMRVSELTGLRDADLDVTHHILKVTGKRNKQRLVPLGPVLEASLHEYLSLRDKEFNIGPGALIVTNKGKAAYVRFIHRLVTRYLGLVSTLRKKSPHVLRHTFATHMLNDGADLNTIKEILGHASLAATQVYTHNTIDKLKTIYKQAHPKA